MGDPLSDFDVPLTARASCLDGQCIKILNMIVGVCAGQWEYCWVAGRRVGPLVGGEWGYTAIAG